MAQTKEERWRKIHQESMSEFDLAQSAVWSDRMQCLEDRRFYSIAGAQWEGALGEQFANKPRFEVNKCHLAVIKIINEYRNNRIDARFVPRDGSPDDAFSDVCNGLYRADEHESTAEEAYDNAFEEAVGGGFGAWRLRAVYENEDDDDSEEQCVRIEPIFDADSTVFFDRQARRQDKADAKKCWVLVPMTPEAYKDEWGDDPATWPKEITQTQFDWYVPNDTVYVAEYYVVENQKQTIHVFRGLDDSEQKYTDAELEDEDGALLDRLQATGFREVRQKKIKRKRVHKYIISGGGVLEDCGFIPGKNIPIVPVYGKRWVVDNVERCMGHVRLAKDPQRLKNMQLSKLGEISALSSIEKPIFTREQIAGNEVYWSRDNIENYPYMLINSMTDAMGNPVNAGPVGYTKAPEIPPAMAALLQLTEADMQDILGNPETAQQANPNQSGFAVELQQTRMDMQNFIYISNFAKAIKRSAQIWYDMSRELLVEQGRKRKTMSDTGEIGQIELNRPVVDEETAAITYENNFAESDMEVFIEVGPSSTSRRQATVRMLTQMIGLAPDPETQQVLSALAMYNMEGEGISEARQWFRQKLLNLGVVTPTKEEQAILDQQAQAAANQPPDPNAIFLQASAQKAQADAIKSQTAAQLDAAKTEQVKAETAKTVTDMTMAQQDHYLNTLERISGAVAASTQPPAMGENTGE